MGNVGKGICLVVGFGAMMVAAWVLGGPGPRVSDRSSRAPAGTVEGELVLGPGPGYAATREPHGPAVAPAPRKLHSRNVELFAELGTAGRALRRTSFRETVELLEADARRFGREAEAAEWMSLYRDFVAAEAKHDKVCGEPYATAAEVRKSADTFYNRFESLVGYSERIMHAYPPRVPAN